jgi:hypothetical protein
MSHHDEPQAKDPLAALTASLGGAGANRGAPPVERWNPPYCGEIDMRIAADGSWFYMGTPIGRPALVKLFASVLRKDEDRYVLVTPVERVGIAVDDAPFMAVEMAVTGEGGARRIALRTNVDDIVEVGSGHPLRFETAADGALTPYVHVRRGLWAKVSRALMYDLVELAQTKTVDGIETVGLAVGEHFFPIAPSLETDI